MSISHDPKKIIELLRDNLARHDKTIGFFFGAGTSSAVNVAPEPEGGGERGFQSLIPAVVQLTAQCKEEVIGLGENYERAWDIVEGECRQRSQDPNIENILSRVQSKRAAIGDNDVLSGLTSAELENFENSIRQKIAGVVQPDYDAIPSHIPHDNLSLWISKTSRQRPIEVFTLNYDILLERSFEACGIPVFDGFIGSYEPFFYPEAITRAELMPGKSWTRLWKIHGSVNWRRLIKNGVSRIVRGKIVPSGEMILPSQHKYDESRKQPYVALIEHLGKFLDQDDALLFVSGYSFGDEHINNVLYTVLSSRPRTHIIALQYSDLGQDDQLLKFSGRLKNLTVLYPSGAVIGGSHGDWRMIEQLDEHSIGLVSPAFEPDPPRGDEPSLTGKFRLGDFNVFCKFLVDIAGKRSFDIE